MVNAVKKFLGWYYLLLVAPSFIMPQMRKDMFLWLWIGFCVILGIGAVIAGYAKWPDWGAYLLTLVRSDVNNVHQKPFLGSLDIQRPQERLSHQIPGQTLSHGIADKRLDFTRFLKIIRKTPLTARGGVIYI